MLLGHWIEMKSIAGADNIDTKINTMIRDKMLLWL